MFRFKYIFRLFLAVGILMVGISGCMFGKKIFTLEQITEYMGQKYNDTFTVRGTDLQSPFEDKTLLALYSEKLGVNIQVYYQSENSNIEEALTDNYMSYALKPDIEALLRPMAEEIYGTVKVFYYVLNSDPFEPQGPETTADQLLSSGEPIGLVVLLPPDTDHYQERGEALVQKMREKGYNPLLTILYLNDEDAYASADSQNYNDYLVPEYRLLRCDHMVTEDSREMEWRDQNGPIPTEETASGEEG